MTTEESADEHDALPRVFDVRHWLASQLAFFTAANLVLVSDEVDWAGRRDVAYERQQPDHGFAGRLLISPARTFLNSEPPQRIITATWPGGEATTRIPAEVEIRV